MKAVLQEGGAAARAHPRKRVPLPPRAAAGGSIRAGEEARRERAWPPAMPASGAGIISWTKRSMPWPPAPRTVANGR